MSVDSSDNNAAIEKQREIVDPGHHFPHGATIGVGAWLLASAVFLVVALLLTLRNEGVPVPEGVYFLVVTIFAGAIGATITTILGYLDHACEKGDFRTSYVPWYVGRPIMGSLLAIVVYCLLETPFLSLSGSGGQPIWNEWQLAGLAGLVGLFSRPAVEKLKEVFQVIFAVRDTRPPNDQEKGAAQEGPRAGVLPGGRTDGESTNETDSDDQRPPPPVVSSTHLTRRS